MSNGHDNHRWMQGAAAALMLVSGAWAFEAPPGDTCAQADAITGVGVFPFDSTGATSDGPTHDACALGGGADIAADVWFCWTSPGDGAVTLDTCSGTTVDTKIAVYDGCACPPGDANLLTCGDDACVYQTRVTFDAVAGGQYLVRLGAHPGLGGGEGVFTITLGDVAEPACTAVGAACQPRTLWNAYNSARQEHVVADDFTPATMDDVSEICWWGTYFDGTTGCQPPTVDAFEIRYFEDVDGRPGPLVAGPFVQADGTLAVTGPARTGTLIGDTVREYAYTAEHAPWTSAPGQCYWVEISTDADGSCTWFWETASANGRALQAVGDAPDYAAAVAVPEDLAFCLNAPLADGAFCVPVQLNDACADALPVTDGVTTFDTRGAATDGEDQPDCGFPLGDPAINRDVWFDYVPPCTGIATVTLCDSLYDTKMTARVGAACAPDTAAVACNDDACGAALQQQSTLSFQVVAGETYKLRIGGYQTASGPGTMIIAVDRPDCNANGIGDNCEILDGTADDCNANGVPDECDVSDPIYTAGSGVLPPIGAATPMTVTFDSPPPAAGDVTITISAIADLGDSEEAMYVTLNDAEVGVVFDTGAHDCPDEPDVDTITVAPATYNELLAGGDAAITLIPFAGVLLEACLETGFVIVDIAYERADASMDCNENDVPDECQPGDLDGDEDVDLADFSEWDMCATGPAGGPLAGCCHIFDFDSDGDVDLVDVAGLQTAFTGN